MGPLIPLFETSGYISNGFKVKVGSLICTWWRHMCYMFTEIHLWCDTCWLLGSQHGSWINIFHIQILVGLKTRIVLQTNDLPTELCWLGLLCAIFIGYKHFGPCGSFCPVIRIENTGKLKSHFSIHCQEDCSQVSCIKKSHVSIQGWLQSDVKISLTRMRYDQGHLGF